MEEIQKYGVVHQIILSQVTSAEVKLKPETFLRIKEKSDELKKTLSKFP